MKNLRELKERKEKRIRKVIQTKVWIQSCAISARQYLQMRKAKCANVTNADYKFLSSKEAKDVA